MIDTHCHLDEYENIDEVIKKMDEHILIVSGTNDKSNRKVIELCEKYKNIYGTIGIHPEEIDTLTDNSLKFIEANINNPKIVGIGEIGLDYYWNKENKQEQQKLFIDQILLAKKCNKCIVIHSRDAINDTYDILSKYARDIKIDIHCFGGSLEMAKKFIELGAVLGIGGVVTFKNGKKLQDVVKNIDISHLVLETDSPYLSPEPFRGKINEPYNVYYIAKKISEIKNMSIDDVILKTTANAIRQFDLSEIL